MSRKNSQNKDKHPEMDLHEAVKMEAKLTRSNTSRFKAPKLIIKKPTQPVAQQIASNSLSLVRSQSL